MHESLQGATFHIEHVIPQCKGGRSELNNLALACPSCNLHKGSRVSVPASDGVGIIRLFHPVMESWAEHFRFSGYEVVGLTREGRATVEALNMNHPRRIRIRQVEEDYGIFPPGISQ
jgi:hypothetical protein